MIFCFRTVFALLALLAFFPCRAFPDQEWTTILEKAKATLDAKSAIIEQKENELPVRINVVLDTQRGGHVRGFGIAVRHRQSI